MAQAEAVAVATKNRQPPVSALPSQPTLPTNPPVAGQPTVASKPQMMSNQASVTPQNIGKSPQNSGNHSQTSPHMSPQTATPPHHSPAQMSGKVTPQISNKTPTSTAQSPQPAATAQTPNSKVSKQKHKWWHYINYNYI